MKNRTLKMRLIETLRDWNGTDLTKVAYPIIIFITGWYIVANLYNLFLGEGDPVYVTVWTLVPVAFLYLAVRGIRLKFRWSALSAIGFIMILAFTSFVFLEAISPYFDLPSFLLSGLWDHFLWPIAFGLFFLCDLRRLPRCFWLMLSPFAFFCLVLGNLAFITHAFFGKSIIPDFPGILVFWWGVESWEELSTLPWPDFIRGLTFFLQELVTFFSTSPAAIFYYLIKGIRRK
jgi:multidrug transporter EmrE-like cation transporter